MQLLLRVFPVILTVTEGAGAGPEGPPEVPNIVTILYDLFGSHTFAQFLHHWENVFFSVLIAIMLGVDHDTVSAMLNG